MAIAVHVTLRGVSKEQYDAVRAQAAWLEQPPSGGISHVTWWEGEDCHNLDAWESEAAFAAFGEQRLAPAMASCGISVQPEFTLHPLHEAMTPRAEIVAPTAPPSITLTDNVSLIRRGYEAFAAGDVAAVLELLDNDVDWYTPDSVRFGGRYRGPAAVGQFFSKLPENFQELNVQPQRYVDRADTVVAIGKHGGRGIGGTEFELPFVHVWTLSNGKATSFTEHLDTVRLNAVIGLVTQAVPAAAGSSTRR